MPTLIRPAPVLITVLACLILAGCKAPVSAPSSKSFLVMGTFASVTLPPDSSADIDSASRQINATLADLERSLSARKPESEVSLISASAGSEPISVSPHTLSLLKLAKYYGEISEGAFDPTVGALVEAWGLGASTPAPRRELDSETIARLLEGVGWQSLLLSEATAFLEKPGAKLDLGAIAKGYAVDVCCHQLPALGIQNALVDLGGNLRGMGLRSEGEPWTVGIRNPFRRDEMLGTISISNGEAVATSGNYERFVTIRGKRYAHIIDPRSGKPVEGMAAVTVVSHSAVEADALSTALFVLGPEKGIEALERSSSSEAMFIPDRRPIEIIVTPALARRFKPVPAVTVRVIEKGL